MDEHLRRDNTGRLWEAFVAFDKYSRGPTTTISEYISTFDILYNKLNRAGDVTLPESVLGLLLVRRANLTLEEAKLVMTGVDYSKEEVSLFMQAKGSLRKFSDELVSSRSSYSGGIQQEIAHETEAKVYQTSRGGGAKWSRGSERGYSGQTGTARNRNGHFQDGGAHAFRSGNSHDDGPHTYRSGHFQDGGPQAYRTGQKSDYAGEKLNPKDRNGDFLRCHCCGSFRHLVRKCPDATTREAYTTEAEDKKFTVMFAHGASECMMSEGSEEDLLCAVLDSACSSTVCGREWLDKYLSVLDKKARVNVTRDTSSHVFKFGGDETLPSLGRYRIPANIADRQVLISTDVVNRDIPLLLSLDAMKKAGVVLHTQEDRATIFGKNVDLKLTASGHYCVPLVDKPHRVNEVFTVTQGTDTSKCHTGDSAPSAAALPHKELAALQVTYAAQIASLKTDLQTAQVNIADLREKNATLTNANQELKSLGEQTEDDVSQLQLLTDQLRYENSSMREVIATEKDKTQKLQMDLNSVILQTDSLTKKYQDAVGRLEKLESRQEKQAMVAQPVIVETESLEGQISHAVNIEDSNENANAVAQVSENSEEDKEEVTVLYVSVFICEHL
ncbi:uncharacterized protein LOC144863466 [Branchiostoma floridae x Branchiostoma japonicum]